MAVGSQPDQHGNNRTLAEAWNGHNWHLLATPH